MLAILPLLLSAASSVMQSRQDEENKRKQLEYDRKKQKAEEEQARRDYLAQRMSNLGRILGKRIETQTGKPVEGPELPEQKSSDIAQILGSLGSYGSLMNSYNTGENDPSKSPVGSVRNPIRGAKGGTARNPRMWYANSSPYDDTTELEKLLNY